MFANFAAGIAVLVACGNGTAPASTTPTGEVADTTTTTSDIPAFYANFGNGVTVTRDGDYVLLGTKDLPDHNSPYFGAGNARYEAYSGANASFQLNPNRIVEQQMVFRIPITPTRLTTPSPTPLGAIGIAVNGVALFNQYAANYQPLGPEINSFDQYNGHPQPTGQYHYHVEPLYLTRASKEALIGVLLDGYPVYGPMENGVQVSNSDLDAAHGHVGTTKEFPAGIYHYHTTSAAPYINGSGFAGAPGTVSR